MVNQVVPEVENALPGRDHVAVEGCRTIEKAAAVKLKYRSSDHVGIPNRKEALKPGC
jgi:hypothetical protein